MKQKKVLHISYGGLGNGGVSSVILSIEDALRDHYDFGCVVFNSVGVRESQFAEYGKLYRLACYPQNGRQSLWEMLLRPFRMFFGVYWLCKREGYEVVHAHNGEEIGFCLLAAKCAGVKVRLAHSHNTPSPRKLPFYKKVQQRVNLFLIEKSATALVGCSEAACRSFFQTEQFRVVYNSVDLSRFDLQKKTAHDRLTFIHVGRFCYQKNQPHVIDTFFHIHRQLPHAKLYLVGFGPEEAALRRQIAQLSLENCVEIIPGDRVAVEDYYALADYMIFPSCYEGFGIVLIEAQAMGIRCFVSDAVQKEADAGLLTWINLEKSPQEWARIILDEIQKEMPVDEQQLCQRLKAYDSCEVAKKYDSLYRGETE